MYFSSPGVCIAPVPILRRRVGSRGWMADPAYVAFINDLPFLTSLHSRQIFLINGAFAGPSKV